MWNWRGEEATAGNLEGAQSIVLLIIIGSRIGPLCTAPPIASRTSILWRPQLEGPGTWDQLPDIESPMLLVAGLEDPIIPAQASAVTAG